MYDALIKLTGVNLGGFRGSFFFFFDFHLYSNVALLIWFSLLHWMQRIPNLQNLQ